MHQWLQSILNSAVTRAVKIFLTKACPTAGDSVTDILLAESLISGGFGITLYYLAQTKDTTTNEFGTHLLWGILALLIVWIPAIVKVSLRIMLRGWKGMKFMGVTRAIFSDCFLFVIWPAFSLLL